MLRVIGVSCLSILVAGVAAAPAQAFPQWEVKPPPAFAPLPANTPLKVTPGGRVKIVIDAEMNKCVLKGDAEPVENTGGARGTWTTARRQWRLQPVRGLHRQPATCTPTSTLAICVQDLAGRTGGTDQRTRHVFALSTSLTEVEVSCASGIAGAADRPADTGSLEPEVKRQRPEVHRRTVPTRSHSVSIRSN